ncbi:MAG TPA: serine hydrolase [Pyrinomonadaceae bacterium]|nr:serine hydrolase [Pyrinomonadaceae bacterium]
MKKLAQMLALALLLHTSLFVPAALAQKTKSPAPRTGVRTAARYSKAIQQFDEFTRKQMALDKTVGLTIGFVKDDFVWVKGYGYADLENKSPAKAESAYRLASVTKPMTAVAILQLVDKGKIDLDAEVQTYVPYFPKKQWPVTVRQVLGHMGGISHYKNPENELHIKTHKNTRESIAIFEAFDLVAEPGTRYSYSSYGYNLLGAIVEVASGMSFGDYMRQHVWQPLGMNDTRMDDPLDVIPNRVRGYQLVNGQVKNSEFIDISSRFAGGGTRSTVPDMLKFAKGVMEQKLLKPETWDAMSTSMSTKAGRLTNYGMGWETTPYNGRYMLVHSGGQQETRTLLYIIPAQRMAIAVGVNFEGSNPGTYVERLFQLLTGAPVEMNLYSPDKLKNATLLAVKATFDYGMSAFERSRRLPASDQEIADAFTHFNATVNPETVKANPQEAMSKIGQGVHPVSKNAFTKVGAYMAQRLGAKSALDSYPARGGLAFFDDYIALTRTDPSIPKEMRFNESFETLVTGMSRDWNRSNTAYMRELWLLPDSDLDALAKTMRQTFAGASVYPNLVDDLFSVTRQFVLRGENAGAMKTGRLAVEFYPEHPLAQFMAGFGSLLNNDRAAAVAAFKKSSSISPGGPASAGGLNGIAYQLAGVGKLDHALAVLEIATQLYPKEANLYDSTGEFLLRKGEKAKALDSYKKALETSPDYPNAAAAKEIVNKLSNELTAAGSK